MEAKKSKRPSFSLWLIPAAYGFWIATYCIITFFLVPLIGEIIPPVFEYFNELNEPENFAELLAFDTVVKIICTYIAFIPATVIAYIFSKRARRDFIDETKCLVGYKEGLKYHISKYWMSDIIFFAALYFCLWLLRLMGIYIMGFVPLVAAAYEVFGFFLGWIIFVLYTYSASLSGVFFAQRKWRADYLSE